MTENDFKAIIANQIMESLRDEFPITMDYDDNTFAWLEKGREIAAKAWPTIKILVDPKEGKL